jgi:uncharacterized protein with HEPN domain
MMERKAMPRNYEDYLNDILDAIRKIEAFTKGMTFEIFKEDDKTVFAVIRAMEIIGEAAKHIPDDVRSQHPQVPWKAMAGMRDVLAHDYFGVNLNTIWMTVREKIPSLEAPLKHMLGK